MQKPTGEITINFAEFDEETLKATQYLMMQERNATMQEIADFFGVSSRQTVYTWVVKWEESGALEKARQVIMIPKAERIKAVYGQVLDNWGNIVLGVASIAQNTKMPGATRVMAAEWIRQVVVAPILEAQTQPGSIELAYADSETDFNPSVVKLPAALKKKLKLG